MNLVQLLDSTEQRRVALVDADQLLVLNQVTTIRELAQLAIRENQALSSLSLELASDRREDYRSALETGRILTPLDHPDPAHCILTGTGLTHLGSAAARDGMHRKAADDSAELTDSLRMFRMGLEGGKPQDSTQAGVQPEWFYKGDGSWLVKPGEPLSQPAFALDGGEEPELAGLYLIDNDGQPVRIGFALGNEYSDHITEKQNYLYLAHSKLRQSAVGPELFVGQLPAGIEGTSRIIRSGSVVWEKPFLTGEANMSHSFANLEYHHFKYRGFRRPGDVHIHFFGTATLSTADGIRTQDGDIFEITAEPFGAPLRNPLRSVPADYQPGGARSL